MLEGASPLEAAQLRIQVDYLHCVADLVAEGAASDAVRVGLAVAKGKCVQLVLRFVVNDVLFHSLFGLSLLAGRAQLLALCHLQFQQLLG